MPESEDFLSIAIGWLDESKAALAAGINRSAARNAYLAALNSARAIIFEKTQKLPKSHSGTHALLDKLIHEGLDFDPALAAFLRRSFGTKQASDYFDPRQVAALLATDYVANATAFVERARQIVGRP